MSVNGIVIISSIIRPLMRNPMSYHHKDGGESMVCGYRTVGPLAVGFLIGILLTLSFIEENDERLAKRFLECPSLDDGSIELEKEASSEHWEVVIKKLPPITTTNAQSHSAKVVRPRFAASELDIHDKLLVMIFEPTPLSSFLNHSLSAYGLQVRIFADVSSSSADSLHSSNVHYKTNDEHALIAALDSFANLTHKNYDWYLLVAGTSYVNPFELMRFVNGINWNEKVAISGIKSGSGSYSNKDCCLQAGILLSHPAMLSLIEERRRCESIAAYSDGLIPEQCIRLATNLSCVQNFQGRVYNWWKAEFNKSMEQNTPVTFANTLSLWSMSPVFNRSIVISSGLSENYAKLLHNYFIRVEINENNHEIEKLENEIEELSHDVADGPTWPVGVNPYTRPPNRYLVPKWQYFTMVEIFKNEPNQNHEYLTGDDKLDVVEVLLAARNFAEGPNGMAEGQKFLELRNGYRLFDAKRGMDYILDLSYLTPRNDYSDAVVHRIHLSRPIANTKLLSQVPYVKEDSDLTIVIALDSNDEVRAVRYLLARYVNLCLASINDPRQTRLVVAVKGIDSSAVRLINNDIIELKMRCKTSQMETLLLLLKSDSHPMTSVAALDEAVDHFGENMIYLLLSPFADIQRDFLNRVRINTIKNFQVFFPIPFVEYHPQIVSANEALQATLKEAMFKRNVKIKKADNVNDKLAKASENHKLFVNNLKNRQFARSSRQPVVHKDEGRFDSSDFSVVSVYGADYLKVRKRIHADSFHLDFSLFFIDNPGTHLLRAVEPALRLRYHLRKCDLLLPESEYARCFNGRRENLATKAQIANLLFNAKEIITD